MFYEIKFGTEDLRELAEEILTRMGPLVDELKSINFESLFEYSEADFKAEKDKRVLWSRKWEVLLKTDPYFKRMQKLFSVFATNPCQYDGESVLGINTARFNHSCQPNLFSR